jgi:hypothetical protein
MNPLEQITAALQARTQPAAQVAGQQPLAFVPAPAIPFGTQVGPGVAPANNPFNPAAAFAAAVPAAAQQHVHPSTGVPFAPINPPGEAVQPTVGLDQAAPLNAVAELVAPFVQAKAPDPAITATEAPAEAPKARRARKAKDSAPSAAEAADFDLQASSPLSALAAGSGAAGDAAAAAPSDDDLSALLQHAPTEDLCTALEARGWRVELKRG